MRPFSALLFFRHRRRGNPWAVSWKLYLASGISLSIGLFIDFVLNSSSGRWLFILAIVCYLIGRIANFFEFRPLNGKLDGYLKINEDHFEINGKPYPYSHISDFNFKVADYYGESLGNNNYGGPYSQGVGNWIAFTESGIEHRFYFQFYSDPHVDAFYEAIVKLFA